MLGHPEDTIWLQTVEPEVIDNKFASRGLCATNGMTAAGHPGQLLQQLNFACIETQPAVQCDRMTRSHWAGQLCFACP